MVIPQTWYTKTPSSFFKLIFNLKFPFLPFYFGLSHTSFPDPLVAGGWAAAQHPVTLLPLQVPVVLCGPAIVTPPTEARVLF